MLARLAVLATALSLGCASARLNRENVLALAAADARVLEGCYDCLLYARETYERIAASRKAKTGDSIFVRIFETSLLLALREKELALDSRSTIEFARVLLPRLPTSLDAQRLLRMVDVALPDGTGRPSTVEKLKQTHASYIPRIPGEIAWLATAPIRPVVRNYIALALECSYAEPKHKRPQLAVGAPPIIVYRTGICTNVDPTIVWRALTAVPVFHDAAYFLGSAAAMAAEETGGDAARLLSQAYARFPRAVGVTFMSGWLGSVIGNCPSAVRYFDETLAIDTLHEHAMLQRTMCLSNLHRDSAAIVSATQLIPIETETKGQGYYWRAVSRLRLKELPSARSDIEAAKALTRRSPTVLTLAGIIEHDQNDLAIAEKDLREARDAVTGDQNCTAAWYLALVLNKGNRPRESAEQFELAMSCYDFKVAVIRSRIAKAQEKASQYPEFTAKRIARLAADSVDQRSRYYASAFNAAGNIANAGNRARALELLEVAASDPKLSEPVAKLRAAIGSMR
jgi:tetratricopeptide (TPR) repeat protein